MSVYRTTGNLIHAIEADNYDKALEFLTEDDMTGFMDSSIAKIITNVAWFLEPNGYAYSVTATTTRDLSEDELRVLREWISGQNSDGLGESFEQQDFAWVGEEGDCGDCEGCEEGYTCDMEDEGNMASFDWQTNRNELTKIA